jgi:hypothetical protein
MAELSDREPPRIAAPPSSAELFAVTRYPRIYAQGARAENSFVRQRRTICFAYRAIGLLDQKNDPAFAALGDLNLVAGLANEVGMSITDSGSVQSTSSRRRRQRLQRLARLQRRQRTFQAGEIELWSWSCVQDGEARCLVNADQFRSGWPRTESRRLPGETCVTSSPSSHQPIGIDQRRQQARALARKFDRLERAVLSLAQGDADIFAAGDLLLVGEAGATGIGTALWLRPTAPDGRPHHMDEGDKLATGLPGNPMNGVPPMMPIATGRRA